jgi:hypothetical protein
MLNPTGTINITAANAALGSVTANGGVIHFNSGTLSLPGTVNIADGGVLGPSVNLTSNHLLTVGGITVAPAHTLTLSGGTLNTATLTNSGGTVAFNSGTINITGGSGFTISSGGGLGATLELGSQQNFNVSGVANIASDGTLVVNSGGQFSTGTNLVNGGEIRLGGGTARVTVGNVLQNSRLITGDGRIVGGVTNNAAGEIRVGNGQRIYLSAGSEQNSGKINLIGGTLETESGLINNAGGTISGRGTLIAHAGTANAGNIQFSGGASDVFGLTVNNSGGKIIVSGNALATFYDAVFNNSGGEIRVSNGSTAVFFGDVTNQGTFASTGTKFFESTSTGVLGAVASGGTTIIANGADIHASYLREAALTVDGDMSMAANGGTSRVGALTVGDDGSLDLSNNKMIVAGGDVGAFAGGQYSGLTGDIARAYNFGAWDAAGIKTTQTNAGPTVGLTTIAINTADDTFYAGSTFGGVSVSSGDVLLMYTYAGDVNLDGLVDASDYGIIDNYFQFPGTTGYANGDFNYDGVIDAGDYGLDRQRVPAPGRADPRQQRIRRGALGVTAVPEPAACGFAIAVGAGALLSRRRSRRR